MYNFLKYKNQSQSSKFLHIRNLSSFYPSSHAVSFVLDGDNPRPAELLYRHLAIQPKKYKNILQQQQQQIAIF